MEKDLDKKLYNDYLNGQKDAFEFLYNKYKKRIEYFIFNIVRNYEEAEDIAQDVFIYVMQNKMKENISFKYYIYMVAKSRAINHIKTEKRRTEITEQYLHDFDNNIEKDILQFIAEEETRKEVIEAINLLDEKYKNAIFLVKIEGLSYEETSKILGQTLQNTKNLIHRGKKELRKILLKKGYKEMNKVLKVFIIIITITVLLAGIVYATTVIYNNYIKNNTNHKINISPSYQSTLDEHTTNNLWVGTLDLAWKELESILGKNQIELEEGNLPIVDELNKSEFSKGNLNSNDCKIDIQKDEIGGYTINAELKKHLNFLEAFDDFSDYTRNVTFGNGENYIKYFGINHASSKELDKNVEILFFNSKDGMKSSDFAVKLFTKEGDEIILYRTDDEKNIKEYYEDVIKKSDSYTGTKEFGGEDELLIPFVRANGMISYNELFGKYIKDSGSQYFRDVVQNVNFSLNNEGCNLESTATIVTDVLGISLSPRYCYFNDKFVIIMKEKDSESPYFVLKVDNDDILEKVDEISEPKIVDYSKENSERYQVPEGETQFFEDKNYKYYFPTKKSFYVYVYFPNGNKNLVEWALKNGTITIDLLDKYEIEYIKKEK